MKTCVLLLLAVVVAVTGRDRFEFTKEWNQWKKEHGKSYSSHEEEYKRRVIWESNKNYVDNHNKHAEEMGFTLEMNKFADLESTEFASIYNGYRQSLNNQVRKSGGVFTSTTPLKDLPDTMDWRAKGYVTKIKNQGQCGSCWAFSTTGSLEGQHFNATGKLVSLSEQNLIDCSGSEGNHGCEGGLMDLAFQYIIKNDGIDKEEFYRYKAHNEPCRYWKIFKGATVSSYKDIPSKSESDLQAAVATIGPISVAIDASKISFQLYSGGVYYESRCSETRLDHGVLAVGYGTKSGKDYWLVKNSWGTDWGNKGYIMMSRNKNNNCGIATNASFPIV